MKIINRNKLHKVKLSSDYSSAHRCKVCKITFNLGIDKNLKVVNGLIWVSDEHKVEKEYVYGIFPTNKHYEREVFEIVNLHIAVCPNCGKEKILFYSKNMEKVFDYSEWKELLPYNY